MAVHKISNDKTVLIYVPQQYLCLWKTNSYTHEIRLLRIEVRQRLRTLLSYVNHSSHVTTTLVLRITSTKQVLITLTLKRSLSNPAH